MKAACFAVFTLVIGIGVLTPAHSAHAWYLELTKSDATLTEGVGYQVDLYFRGEEGDNLNTFFIDIDYDETLVSWNGLIDLPDYKAPPGGVFDPVIWNGGILGLSHDEANGYISNVNGSESLGYAGMFFPILQGYERLATLAFDPIDSGDYENIVSLETAGKQARLVEVNGVALGGNDLITDNAGQQSVLSPVPVPGALWLFSSGILGVVALGRRFRR